MISAKRTSRLAGLLIILGMLAGILSVTPAVEHSDFLNQVFIHKHRVLKSTVFQFLLAPIYIGFAVVLYPLLRPYSTRLSTGFLGFRFVAGTLQLLGAMLLPLLILLSEHYGLPDTGKSHLYSVTGNLLKLLRDLVNHMGVILATGIGNVLFYLILLKNTLMPRWLSWWGVAGNVSIMAAGFFMMYDVFDVISPEYGIMSLPVVLQEIILAIWLITKGFK